MSVPGSSTQYVLDDQIQGSVSFGRLFWKSEPGSKIDGKLPISIASQLNSVDSKTPILGVPL